MPHPQTYPPFFQMQIHSLLKNFGLNDKETAVYTALIELGPSPVRTIASKSKVNRGTSYDILKSLIDQGLVTYYNQETKQYFVAESPEKLIDALEDKQKQLEEVKKDIQVALPELQSMFEQEGGRPTVKLYEGAKGVKKILEDVLETLAESKEKTYYVYSSSSLRKNVYDAMPDFSKKRISKKILVNTISLDEGGQLVGLDARKWLPAGKDNLKSTYELIYNGKVAHISLGTSDNPIGVVIENEAIYQTQKLVFEFLWNKL